MFTNYLVTGATGFLGLTVVRMLAARGERVTALVLKGDASAARLPAGVRVSCGNVADRDSLADFFSSCDEQTCVIHCAGMISIRTTPGKRLRAINVTGTANIVALCQAHRAGKLIYVSSVHAIPEAKKGAVMAETTAFSPQVVSGPYAKTKAEATALVLDAAKNGLNACVVHPSGIVGPEDYNLGSISSMIISYCRGRLPLGVEGGYDFVDVRDVASGILACCEKGVPGDATFSPPNTSAFEHCWDACRQNRAENACLPSCPPCWRKSFPRLPRASAFCAAKSRASRPTPWPCSRPTGTSPTPRRPTIWATRPENSRIPCAIRSAGFGKRAIAEPFSQKESKQIPKSGNHSPAFFVE